MMEKADFIYCPTCGKQMSDWSGWIAVLFDNGDYENYCIAPKEFWEKNHYIPDRCLAHVPHGFVEISEHTLDCGVTLNRQKQMLIDLGFEIVNWDEE